MKHTIDLLDTNVLMILSSGIHAKLSEIYADNTDGYSMRDLTARQVSIKQQYLMLAKIDVQFEQSYLKDWQHAPLEKKLARAKIATAKVNVEVADAELNEALDSHREARKVIVIPHAAA